MGLSINKLQGDEGARKEINDKEPEGENSSLFELADNVKYDWKIVRKHPEFAPFY